MASHAVARDTVVALRHKIAKIEGRLAERLEAPAGIPPRLAMRQPALPTGIAAFDAALGGGLPLAGLVELHGAAVRDGAGTAGFALALARLRDKAEPDRAGMPLLWIGTAEMFREAGRPYAPGLAVRFGLPPDRLLVAEAPRTVDALWIAEQAAVAGVFSSVLVELRGAPSVLDLTATRRLHRRALLAGRPLLLIRQSGIAQPTAAPLRLLVAPERAAERRTIGGALPGSIGPPAFRVTVDKSRASRISMFTLEWSNDAFQEKADATHPGAVVPLPAGGTADAPALRTVVAFQRPGRRPGLQPPREQHAARRGA